MSEETKQEVSLIEKLVITVKCNIFIMGLIAIWAIVKIQFLGQEFVLHSFGFQNRPILTDDQRSMFSEEAEARHKSKG